MEMSERTDPEVPGPYDRFLTERLAQIRREHPEWPRPVFRLHLMQALRDETPVERRKVMATVDDFLARNGLGAPPFSLRAAVIAIVVGLVVLLVPLALLFTLWRQLMGR
jgi:hypothetical protein